MNSGVLTMKKDGTGSVRDGVRDVDVPFGGLFGSISQQRVLQELVADPYSTYTPRDLTELTELTEPTVREAITALLRLGILRNISRRKMRPVYQVNQDSKRMVAMMFLSYAILDDEYGEDHLTDAVKCYLESVHSTSLELEPGELTSVMYDSYWSIAKEALSGEKAYVAASAGV
jgi:hypothetical protein